MGKTYRYNPEDDYRRNSFANPKSYRKEKVKKSVVRRVKEVDPDSDDRRNLDQMLKRYD